MNQPNPSMPTYATEHHPSDISAHAMLQDLCFYTTNESKMMWAGGCLQPSGHHGRMACRVTTSHLLRLQITTSPLPGYIYESGVLAWMSHHAV